MKQGWDAFRSNMDGHLNRTGVVLNGANVFSALIDEGCQCYAAISADLFNQLGLPLVNSCNRTIKGPTQDMNGLSVTGVTAFRLEIDGLSERAFAYIVPGLEYPLILGNPWKTKNKVRTAPDEGRFYHGLGRRWIDLWNDKIPNWIGKCIGRTRTDRNASVASKKNTENGISIHSVKLSDIEKALAAKKVRTTEDLEALIPPEFHNLLPLFNKREAEKLAPH